MKKKDTADELIEKYQRGNLSDEERAILESWYLKELKTSNHIPDRERLHQADVNMWAAISKNLDRQSKPAPCSPGEVLLQSLLSLFYLPE